MSLGDNKSMRSHKSTQLNGPHPWHTLQLHFSNDKAFHPLKSRVFPQRPSRTYRTPPGEQSSKKIEMLQTMDFLNEQPEKESPRRLASSKASSYLVYKQEQLSSRKHRNVYLKPRSKSQRRCWSSDSGKSVGVEKGGWGRKLSPSREGPSNTLTKIELILNRGTAPPLESTPRQFYLKTAEGKRERITPGQYERRVKARVRSTSAPVPALKLEQYTDTPFYCTVNQVKALPQGKERNRAKVSRQWGGLRGSLPPSEGSCRPWTSPQSDCQK